MKVENNILDVSKALFNNQMNWKFVTKEQKEQFFFIFNRYFSRKYPQLSQLINHKNIDKSLGMDLWFYYMKDKPYPQWFWPKSKKTSNSSSDDSLIDDFCRTNDLNEQEYHFIKTNFQDALNEEINYYKLQKNGNTREKLVHSKGTK